MIFSNLEYFSDCLYRDVRDLEETNNKLKMYLIFGIILILFGLFMLKYSIKFWLKNGIFYGGVFKGFGAAIMGIVLGIALLINFFNN